jgi:hypothetical protein
VILLTFHQHIPRHDIQLYRQRADKAWDVVLYYNLSVNPLTHSEVGAYLHDVQSLFPHTEYSREPIPLSSDDGAGTQWRQEQVLRNLLSCGPSVFKPVAWYTQWLGTPSGSRSGGSGIDKFESPAFI